MVDCENYRQMKLTQFCTTLWLIFRIKYFSNVGIDGVKYCANRGMVYALSPGSPHQLGIENGLACFRWKASKPKAASSTVRSSQMLMSFNDTPLAVIFDLKIFFSLV